MLWPMLALALAFCGLVVLGVLAIRVFVEVRRLAGQLASSSQQIMRAAEDLEQAAGPLASSADALRRH